MHSKQHHLLKRQVAYVLYFSLKDTFRLNSKVLEIWFCSIMRIYLEYTKLYGYKEEKKDPVLNLIAHVSTSVFKQNYELLDLLA